VTNKLSFGSNMKRQRIAIEMSQSELALAIGKNKSSVSQYESGKNIPSKPVKEKIAEVLKCTVEYLETEDEKDVSIKPGSHNVPVWKAALLLEKSEQFIRTSLQMGTAPFGFASKKKGKWSYHISPKRLKEYIGDFE